MLYLTGFKIASSRNEDDFILNSCKLDMTCYDLCNVYPFKLFPGRGLDRLEFAPLTLLYGGNGSGKSTLLNIIAEKLKLGRGSTFNRTPFFEDYLGFCRATLSRDMSLPEASRIITSDDVFDFMLDMRAINQGVSRHRDELFREYQLYNDPAQPQFRLRSLEDYDELRRRNRARRKSTTRSSFAAGELEHEVRGQSNGENGFAYFTHTIRENALYLLDEPENSLSARRQVELAEFISQSARFYGCQFIISTHSPFLLSLREAKIYDLDARPVSVRAWQQLDNVRAYYELFESRREDFAQ
ncbi:MAG: AAA family ATPase [Eubacteriales bacterium]|nr:AAA family ATPase [Eubacteriales bacterium]